MSVPGKSYDVIIIGGGFIGVATAYYLARRGTSVLLIEGKSLGSGSTGACAGRAQVSECHPGLHLDLVQLGLQRLEHLQEELGYDFEWRRFGNIMLVDTEHDWQGWAAQSALLAERGIPAAMWDAQTLKEAEPAVRTDDLMGAAWCLEGHVNPLKYCWAYARAARRFGAEIHTQEPVICIERDGERITGVRTQQGFYGAGQVLVAAGAWTAKVLRTVDVELPLKSTNAMAMISEKLPPVLNNHVGVGNFYETIHKKAKAVALGVLQFQNGSLYIAEAVEMGTMVRMEATPWGPPGMAQVLLDRVPAFAEGPRRPLVGRTEPLPRGRAAGGWLHPGLRQPLPGNLLPPARHHRARVVRHYREHGPRRTHGARRLGIQPRPAVAVVKERDAD